MKFFAAALVCFFTALAPACELCAIYSADSTRGSSSTGLIFTLSQQFVPFRTVQNQGERIPSSARFFNAAYADNSITHLVPGYNITPRIGVSLNLPIVHRHFRRTQATPFGELIDERGTEWGPGDMALVGRWTAYQKRKMDYAMSLNALAGVKFPTGDTKRLEDERDDEIRYQRAFGRRHAHAVGGVHQHDLSLGSGSFDGVFGVTANFRWKRFFFTAQGQYYVRTEAIDYEFGDLFIISGGPGAYLLSVKDITLSLQANGFYEEQQSDLSLGQVNEQTGFRAWYVGPLLAFTWGEHFSANAGVDVPLDIDNRGIQSVPDYRVHGGVSWKF